MKDALALVRGALAKKELVPVLTHFRIQGGRIQGGNGLLAIDAPCADLAGLDVTVPGERFLRAVDTCNGEPVLHITDGGRLCVQQGSFRAYLPLFENDAYPSAQPDTQGAVWDGQWLAPLRALVPFIGQDASRPWACGVLLKDGYAYATNNVTVACVPCPWGGLNEPVVIPSATVDELLRIGREPTEVAFGDTTVTFRVDGDCWLRTRRIDLGWPQLDALLAIPFTKHTLEQGFVAFREAVERVLPFCPDKDVPLVYTGDAGIRTADGATSATVEGLALPTGCFRGDTLLEVLGSATRIDISYWPKPCPWAGPGGLRGVTVGMRQQ